MSFGEYLRKKRKAMGINQTELGKMLGLNKETISNYEIGITSPSYNTAEYIVKRLGGRVCIVEE